MPAASGIAKAFVESADIVLVRSDPRDVADIVGLSKKTYAKMIQNLVGATGQRTRNLGNQTGIPETTG